MAIYGAKLFRSPNTASNYEYPIVGKNSEVFTSGDPVMFVASHGIAVVTGTNAVVGIAAKTVTMASTNEGIAQVKPAIIPIDQDYEFLMGTNSDLTTLASVGAYYKLTGTTGAVQVDVTSGATTGTTDRVVLCTKVDPQGLSDLRQGLFKFVKVANFRGNTTS